MYEFWFENKNTKEVAIVFARTVEAAWAKINNSENWHLCGFEYVD